MTTTTTTAPAAPKLPAQPPARPPVKGAAKPKARKAAKPQREPLLARLRARAARVRFRVLPVMIFMAVLMLGVRTGEVWRLVTRDARLPDFPVTLAGGAQKPAPAPQVAAAGGAPAPAPAQPAPAAAPAPAPGGASSGMVPPDAELLQHYAERRAEIERRSRDLDQREALLAAAEKRIEQKLHELEKMRGDIQKLMRTGDEKQNAQLESLVKIYETMKPKEAARIFEELDMPVLLDVIQRMKEQKTAPILAAMDPVKAKGVTAALVERRVVMPSGTP